MSEYESLFEESPVHIPDLETKHNGHTFTYSNGYHLTVHKHWCSEDVEEYLPRITRTPTGRVSKRQVTVPKQPVLWWRAQWTWEAKLKKEFGQKRRKAEDEWVAKEEEQTKTFLLEYFPTEHIGDADKKTIMLEEGRKYYNLAGVASRMGLHARRYWKGWYYNIIVGRTANVVQDRVLGLENEKKLEEKRKLEAEEKEKKAQRERTRVQYQEVVNRSGKDTNWDVTGSYKIICPYIEENWFSNGAEDFVLRIGRTESSKSSQIFAKFDFGIIAGVFRFEKQVGDKKIAVESSKTTQKVGEKRKREEDDEGENYCNKEDSDEERRSPTPEAFYMPSASKLSPKQPTWEFRWRGEQHEGEICLDSDNKLYKITFQEPFGTKLSSTFGGDAVEDCEFTGVKFSMEKPEVNIGDKWAEHNERAYDRRWRGW